MVHGVLLQSVNNPSMFVVLRGLSTVLRFCANSVRFIKLTYIVCILCQCLQCPAAKCKQFTQVPPSNRVTVLSLIWQTCFCVNNMFFKTSEHRVHSSSVWSLAQPLVTPSPAEWDTQSVPASQHIVRLQQISRTRCPLLIPNLILMKTTTKR